MSSDHNMNQTDSGWRKRQIALDKKAENARELRLDYEPERNRQVEALRLAQVAPYLEGGERSQWMMDAAAELRRLHHNNEVLMNALWKACGDNAEVVEKTIESQGELK